MAYLVVESDWGAGQVSGLVKQAANFAAAAASATFSMLGFLVAAVALFTLLSRSRAFSAYRQNGYLSVYFMFVGVTMLQLTLAFVTALKIFFDATSVAKLGCCLVALTGALTMVVISLSAAVGLLIRAANERARPA